MTTAPLADMRQRLRQGRASAGNDEAEAELDEDELEFNFDEPLPPLLGGISEGD